MNYTIKSPAEVLAEFRESSFPDRRQLAADYDALAARLAEAERLAREWLETHTSTTDQWDCGAYCCAESILTAITAGSADDGYCESCDGDRCTAGPKCVALSNHTPLQVKCARCGIDGTSETFIVEEGDEWECPACWERCEAQERAALTVTGAPDA